MSSACALTTGMRARIHTNWAEVRSGASPRPQWLLLDRKRPQRRLGTAESELKTSADVFSMVENRFAIDAGCFMWETALG